MFTKNSKGNDGGEGEIACSLWGTASTRGRGGRRAGGRTGGAASARAGMAQIAEGADIIRHRRETPGPGWGAGGLGLEGCEGVFPWRESAGNYSWSYWESVRIGGTSFVSLPHPGGHGKIRKLDYCDDQVR